MPQNKMKIIKKPLKGKSPNILMSPAINEDTLQRQVVSKLRAHGAFVILTDAVGPALKFIPSATKRMGFISWSKARGWSKGVTDLLVVWKNHTLFLELKFGKTGKLSEEQRLWKKRIIDSGHEYACWYTIEECRNWIISVLKEHNLPISLVDDDTLVGE